MMLSKYSCLSFILFIALCISKGDCTRTNRVSEKIYRNLQNNFTCFRRLNATHQIGCSSNRGGNVGILHVLETAADVDWLVESGSNSPYIALILEPSLFSINNMLRLKNSGKINGVIVAASKNISVDYPKGFSPDKSCPNENFGLYTSSINSKYAYCKQGEWIEKSNPGLNIMFEDWGFPMSLISEGSDLLAMKMCFEKFNKPSSGKIKNSPMCAAEMKTRMSGAKDTPTCMRRSDLVTNINPSVICDPMGDKNLYTFLYNNDGDFSDRSVIVVAARLDSSSVFFGLTPGADSSISGMVALLAVSEALSSVKDEFMTLTQNKTNVMFVLFNGESFDYIGSSRMVYDMLKNKFSLKMSHISHIIELQQVISSQEQYWVHTDPISLSSTSESVNEMYDLLSKESSSLGVTVHRSDKSRALPPASLQSFLAEDSNISAVLLTNFDNTFSNEFYNGIYDNAKTIKYDPNDKMLSKNIANLATTVARTVFTLATNKSTDVAVDENLVHDMLPCYLTTASCDLFKKAFPISLADKLAKMPYSLYVSVSTITNEVTVATSYLFHYLTGSAVHKTQDECESATGDRYVWINGPNLNDTGVCYHSLVKNHSAISPAFDSKDWSSSKYSTWTESRWDSFSVRIFLKPSLYHEVLTLVLGLSILIISLVFVYFTNKRADILFGPMNSDVYGNGVPC